MIAKIKYRLKSTILLLTVITASSQFVLPQAVSAAVKPQCNVDYAIAHTSECAYQDMIDTVAAKCNPKNAQFDAAWSKDTCGQLYKICTLSASQTYNVAYPGSQTKDACPLLRTAIAATSAPATCSPTDRGACTNADCDTKGEGSWSDGAGGTCNPPAATPVTGNGSATGAAGGAAAQTCADGSTPDATKGCVSPDDPAASGGNCSNLAQCDLVTKYLQPFVNFLAVFVGIAVTASIITGGIMYGSSAGDPSKAAAAKARIRNAIIALVGFMFVYGLINFLIPGGII